MDDQNILIERLKSEKLELVAQVVDLCKDLVTKNEKITELEKLVEDLRNLLETKKDS